MPVILEGAPISCAGCGFSVARRAEAAQDDDRVPFDFGDSWAHRLTATAIRQGETGVSYPRYVGSEWSCPTEDCGGIPGFYDMLEAQAVPEHPEHAEVTEYLDGWDPREIDELPLRIALGRIANRRNAAWTRIAKRRADRPQEQVRSVPI